MMTKGVVPAPQTSSFVPTVLDLSSKFAEWNLPLNETFTVVPMVSKDEAEVLNMIKIQVEAALNKMAVSDTDKQAAIQATQLLLQMQTQQAASPQEM